MLDSILFWVFFAVPEGVMMALAGLGMLGVQGALRKFLVIGVASGSATVLFRALLEGGLHIPFVLITFCAASVVVLRVSVKTAIVACFIFSLLINVGQGLVFLYLQKAANVPLEATLSNVWLNIGFGWLGNILLVVAVTHVLVKKRPFCPWVKKEDGDALRPL